MGKRVDQGAEGDGFPSFLLYIYFYFGRGGISILNEIHREQLDSSHRDEQGEAVVDEDEDGVESLNEDD